MLLTKGTKDFQAENCPVSLIERPNCNAAPRARFAAEEKFGMAIGFQRFEVLSQA